MKSINNFPLFKKSENNNINSINNGFYIVENLFNNNKVFYKDRV